MCGICGELYRDPAQRPDPAVLAAMTDAQCHRGPDDRGIWLRGPVGFGHRRLAILDATGGYQPMVDPNGDATLSFNGELYNYPELRETLRARGRRFLGTGDTEVLLHAYLEWGPAMLERVSGMFAFCVYDARQDRLFAARDPAGQKPLFYYADQQGLIFASELTALLHHPRLPRRPDREALAAYTVYEHVPAPASALEGVRKLPPGHALLYHRATGQLDIWPYWDPVGAQPPAAERPLTSHDEDAVAECLREAVARHLRSDVPVGLYLSGGVDSTTLAILACDLIGGQNLPTFTVSQPDRSFDESAAARRLARQLGTPHHQLPLTARQCTEMVPEALGHLDEPLADPGYLSMCAAASLASRHVKVVLSGDGGDELFCGYEPFKAWALAEQLRRWTTPPLRRVLRGMIDLLPAQYGYMGLWYRAGVFMRGVDAAPTLRNTLWTGAFSPAEAREVLQHGRDLAALQPGPGGLPAVAAWAGALHARTKDWDALNRLSLEYQLGYLPGNICAHTDKANMRFSLEARSPFLDPAVIRHVNGLPVSWKLHGGQSKRVLRRWIARRLGYPLPLKKRGFTVPIARWLRRELQEMAWRHLCPDAVAAVGIFEPAVVRRLWQAHQAGRANHAKKLWTVLVGQHWCARHLFDQPAAPRYAPLASRRG